MRSFGKQVKTLFSVQNLFEWFRKAHILSTFSSNFRFPHLISEISIRTNHSVYRNTRFRSYIRRLVLWNGPSECFCTRNRTYQFQFFFDSFWRTPKMSSLTPIFRRWNVWENGPKKTPFWKKCDDLMRNYWFYTLFLMVEKHQIFGTDLRPVFQNWLKKLWFYQKHTW